MDTKSLIRLWNLTQKDPGTSGAEVAARVLLGLYNGQRFKLDLTQLRRLDTENLKAAMSVIASDANRPIQEVHRWLDEITGRGDFGMRFEQMAYDYKIRGRAKSSELEPVEPEYLWIKMAESAGA